MYLANISGVISNCSALHGTRVSKMADIWLICMNGMNHPVNHLR